MRSFIINYLKTHPFVLALFWRLIRYILNIWSLFVPIQEKTIIFSSYGGRKFDDSPKALYEEICKRKEFDDYRIIWAFVDPDSVSIPRGEKIKIDTYSFFKALLYSKIWISNTGMDRDIGFRRKGIIRVETWHGAPLKKICGEENQKSADSVKVKLKLDKSTIRCAQSEYDKSILARVFNAAPDTFMMVDLPRNDELIKYSQNDISSIKKRIGIDMNKKVILYMPTYREYLLNERNENFLAPPINLDKWKQLLGSEYVLLMRAHYAVNQALNIEENEFVKNVSSYPLVNDLYAIADLLISDYSSSFIDYSILGRPMLCFAYDLEEYEEKRGLYISLADELPCDLAYTEEQLLNQIVSMDYNLMCEKTRTFKNKYAPFAGSACKSVVDEILKKCDCNCNPETNLSKPFGCNPETNLSKPFGRSVNNI